MAFAPFAPPKSLSTILLELYLNRSLPTNSAEEPSLLENSPAETLQLLMFQ